MRTQASNKILCLALACLLALGALPISAFAENGSLSAGANSEIIAFEALPEERAKQTVPLGTSLDKLYLPQTLAATVRAATATDLAVPDQDKPTQGFAEPDAQKTEASETTEMIIAVPVTWISLPEYDGNVAGEYTFTAGIAGYTLCAEPPAITVTVGEAARSLAALAGDAVCVYNGMEYTSADDALPDAFYDGGTLTLLQDIVYNYSVTLENHKSLTVELNGHTLTLRDLTVNNSANLTLSGEGPGAQLNVNNTSASLIAVSVMNSARAAVSNISSASYAALVSSYGSLRVSGNVQGDATGVRFQNSSNASLEIGGNLTVSNADYGIYANDSGGENSITINGDVNVYGRSGSPSVGVYATDSPTIINGGIYVQGAAGSYDIKMGNTPSNRSLGQGSYNASTGYFDYTYWNSRVSVKGYALAVAASVGGTANTNATGPYEGGRKINLTATPNAHYTFAGWTSSNGGTFVNSANVSTTFVMPAAATTVTANFTHYNTAPARRNGVPAAASANVTYGGAYTLNLSDIFTDADGDPLTYKVSVNGAAATGTAAFYSLTPASAGTAELVFTANDGDTDSADSYTVTLTVDKKMPTAADLTYQLAAKTYSGLAQPLSVTGPAGLGAITVKYDGSAIQPKDAKTYAVTVSIAAGINYTATTVDIPLGNYSINKANLIVTGASAKAYDGTTEATGITLTFDGLQNGETLALGTDYTITNAQFDSADAGTGKTVTGTVSLTTTAKAQNYALANGTLSLTGQIIDKAAAPVGVNRTLNAVINHAQGYEFDLTTLLPVIANPRTLGTMTYAIKSTADTGNVLGTLGYTSGNTLTIPVRSVSDANKTAVITVTVKSTNYGDFDADIIVTTVDTIPLTVAGLTIGTKTYDGATAATLIGTETLVTDNVQPDDAVSLSGVASATFADANAGSNKAVTVTGLSLVGTDAHKYRLDLSGFTGTITPKPLTEAILTVTGDSFTYTGAAQTPAITVQDGGTPLVLNTDYESMAYSNNTDAGTASVSVTGKGNYQGTISKDFTIGKALLTITGGTITAKTYDGTTDAEVTGVTFSGLQNGETLTLGTDYIVSGATFDSASVGSGKTVTATVALNNTAKAHNYTLANGCLTLAGQTIQKGTVADVTFDIAVATNLAKDYSMSYQEFAGILADLTGKALGTVSYNLTLVENTDGVLAALPPTGLLTFPVTMRVAGIADAGKKAKLIGAVTSANYNDFAVTAVIRTVDRIPVTISGLTMTGGIYNGSSYAYSGTPLFTSDLSGNPVSIPEFDVLYTSADSGGYSSSLPPQNAGAYQLTISVANSNLAYTGSKSYAFTIAKRPIVIRADDKSMTAGSSLPAFTYTVDGQLSGEAAFTGTPILACAADGKTAGSYSISLDLTGITYTGNYTAAIPSFVAGTLRVNDPSSGGPRTLTDSESGITVSGGGIKSLAELTVTAVSVQSLPAKMREEIATGRMIAGYDITLPGGFRGELTISFHVGAVYEGQTVTILHYVNGRVETYTAVVVNGRATITVSSLSPFAVLITGVTVPDAVVTDPPKTGGAANPIGFMMLGFAAACAVVASNKRRRV